MEPHKNSVIPITAEDILDIDFDKCYKGKVEIQNRDGVRILGPALKMFQNFLYYFFKQ